MGPGQILVVDLVPICNIIRTMEFKKNVVISVSIKAIKKGIYRTVFFHVNYYIVF